MQNLITYNSNGKASFSLKGDLQISGSELLLEYKLSDPEGCFDLPKIPATWSAAQIPRQDGLWEGAFCFEAFLQPQGVGGYYEFNFALNPAWTAYEFNGYREPQPARPTLAFKIKSMSWDPEKKILTARVENKTAYKKFNIGLTSILIDKNGNKHFCALVHPGSKPDFHLIESFIMQRGSE